MINYLKRIINCANKNDKKVFSIYRNDKELETLIELGVHFPIASVDTSQLLIN